MQATEQKEWTREEIEDLISKSNKAVGRALVRLYERQTQEEKNVDAALVENGRGFSKVDAEFGSSLARSFTEYGHFTGKQLPYARKIALKYAGQLLEIANESG